MLRTIAAVVAGIAAWMVGFYAIGISFGLLWPAYAEAARHMFREEDLSYFTFPMYFMNWTIFIGTGFLAGWVASRIGRNRIAPLVVAGFWFLYGIVEHYWLVWDKLPAWYNVIVPFIIAGPIFLWSRLGKSAARARV